MADLRRQTQLNQALAAGTVEDIWAAYMACWEADEAPSMTPSTFVQLFELRSPPEDAMRFIRESEVARKTLKRTVSPMPLRLDRDGLMVWLIALGEEAAIADWGNRHGQLSADERATFAGALIEMLVNEKGRAWVRSHVLAWWTRGDLLEEEREAIVAALGDAAVLTRDLLIQLGPDAGRVEATRITRGESSPRVRGTAYTTFINSKIHPYAAARLNELVTVLEVVTELRDAGLTPVELSKVAHWGGYPGRQSLLSDALARLRRRYPRGWELAELVRGMGIPDAPHHSGGHTVFAVTTIQVLHMKMILEAPELAPALARPEDNLVPEVLLHALGRDAVVYYPEIRLTGGDQRWRARWAESCGEALSALFLESALDLDLSLLERIPVGAEETPDFLCATLGDESHVVFESKGSTHWATHLRQRPKALSQVRKGPGRKRRAPASWKGATRGFACCFFAARQGEERSSLLSVVDPSPAFPELFEDGWKEIARRRHYAAVAQAAGLWGLAERIARPGADTRRPEMEGREREVQFALGAGEAAPQFQGTAVSLFDQAQRLGHPQPHSFAGVRMFVGMSYSLYRELSEGKLPAPSQLLPGGQDAPTVPPGVGLVPGDGPNDEPRGIYSLLADGSLLAFYAA